MRSRLPRIVVRDVREDTSQRRLKRDPAYHFYYECRNAPIVFIPRVVFLATSQDL
jgi:hypothetical protein